LAWLHVVNRHVHAFINGEHPNPGVLAVTLVDLVQDPSWPCPPPVMDDSTSEVVDRATIPYSHPSHSWHVEQPGEAAVCQRCDLPIDHPGALHECQGPKPKDDDR
jgi:hypothetical protein